METSLLEQVMEKRAELGAAISEGIGDVLLIACELEQLEAAAREAD